MLLPNPYPPISIPDHTVFEHVLGGLEPEHEGRIALIDWNSGESVTYGDLVSEVEALSVTFTSLGLRPGDVVALFAPNSAQFVVAFHAILLAEATATTVNVMYTEDELAGQLSDSAAKFVVTVKHLRSVAEAAAQRCSIESGRVLLLDGGDLPVLSHARRSGHSRVTIDPATHTAVLPYSSGTTGRPKGVMLSHRNLVANMCQIQELVGVSAGDRVVAVLPFTHIYGLNVIMNTMLLRRATLVILPRFDLVEFLQAVVDTKCTYLYIAPPIAVALAKSPIVDGYDLSSVRTILTGAAPLDDDLGRAVEKRLGCTVRQGFGMSELSPVSHIIPDGRPDISRASIGVPLPNIDSVLVNPQTGDTIAVPETGVSSAGELWVRGPNVMLGYLGNPEATAATVDEDGFLHTGDLATVSADGVVTIVDRLKELIKYKGHQVAPAELEAVLLTHDSILDAAVIGIHDESGEEVPAAFVVRMDGNELDESAVIDYVASRVAPYKKVRRVTFVDIIPKSPAGKILRRVLRTQ